MSCPDCFRGNVHDGKPTGKEIKLHDFDVYVSEPGEGTEIKGFLIFIPDAFGWKFGNNRLLCDNFASKSSYRVLMPEFMNGMSRYVIKRRIANC